MAASPGRVAVFFPAEKETSGLRFHLHAPFVPELSRASIKETAANDPLFADLAKLAATSLHDIRNLGLLNVEFLGILPNPQDNLSPGLKPIRDAIIQAMDEQPLTPTHHKSHAPAKILKQSKAALKDLLSLEDIEYLIDYKTTRPSGLSLHHRRTVTPTASFPAWPSPTGRLLSCWRSSKQRPRPTRPKSQIPSSSTGSRQSPSNGIRNSIYSQQRAGRR